jgi:DNA-binding transcriptional ArsR family regulator
MRIHFTDRDIGRTRLKLGLSFMWEIVSSVQVLQHCDGALLFDGWRKKMQEVAGGTRMRGVLHRLAVLAPHAPYYPDFLTPDDDLPDFATELDAVLSTPRQRLREEIYQLSTSYPWLDEIANGTSAALQDLRTVVRAYYQAAIHPSLDRIQHALHLDSADRVHAYLHRGPEGVLSSLRPLASWNPPVLTFDYPVERDLHLDGRGLLLVPAYFCLQHPIAFANPQLRPILVHPIDVAIHLRTGEVRDRHTAALLGHTRADILCALTTGATTSGIARRVKVSSATVSHHTAVLRQAGLVTTQRHGTTATHHITQLGRQLLSADLWGAIR